MMASVADRDMTDGQTPLPGPLLRVLLMASGVLCLGALAGADLPWQVRSLAVVAVAASGSALLVRTPRRGTEVTARSSAEPVVASASHVEPPSAHTAHPGGTTQDLQTAMSLFGSVIVEQVDTSVAAVVQENSQMREMAAEMATAATRPMSSSDGRWPERRRPNSASNAWAASARD